MTNLTRESYKRTIDHLLLDIYKLREEATLNYEETGKAFYFGQVDACETIRAILLDRLDDATQQIPEPGYISLVDAIEPDDRLNRIMMKVGAVGEAMRNINSMAAAIVC
jgi:hypothetical protein